MKSARATPLDDRRRFAFGENWARFLDDLDDEQVHLAEQSMREMLEVVDLRGKRFLDIGSGSGLFSLAARRLGAAVHSFDFDSTSVACTNELKRRYFHDDPHWTIESGSVLDKDYLATLGQWDIVYAWGVLHHTGAMWQALANVAELVNPNGKLYTALYNDQGRGSRVWLRVKTMYNALPRGLRWLVLWPATIRLWGPTIIRDLLAGHPLRTWRNYSHASLRGMSPWCDVVDWVGGLPFEVARPEEIIQFYRQRGFQLEQLKTAGGGHACNEFVFVNVRETDSEAST